MLFRLNINLGEDDYLEFNKFHAFESMHGKKLINKTRFSFVLAMVIIGALFLLVMGLTGFSVTYLALLLLFTLLYAVFLKKIATRNLKRQIKRLKKTGKLPFDPEATLEFHEDKIVEITPSRREEYSYTVLERICVVKDRYILLYKNSVSAYILPMAQVQTQCDQEDLVVFLSKKCAKVEHY